MRFLRRLSPGVVLLAIAAVALISVIGLSRQALSAWEQQRADEARMRDNIAIIGARNLSGRVKSMVEYYAYELVAPLLRPELSESRLLAALRSTNDSLTRCNCQPRFQVDVILLRDSTGSDVTNPHDPPIKTRMVLVQRALQHAEVAVFTSGRDTTVAYFALARAPGSRPLVAEVRFRANNFVDKILPFAIDSGGTLIPQVLTGTWNNREAIAIGVVHGMDTLVHSASAVNARYTASAPLWSDSSMTLSASANPSIRLPTIAPSANRGPLVAGLALATMLAVLASTALALRSAQLARVRGDFTAAVSHELRTPLTEIVLFAELLQSGRAASEHEVQDAARIIRTQAMRLHHMVENVLHVTRLDRRSYPMSIQPQHVAPVLFEVLEGFTPIADQRQCVIDIRVESDPLLLVDAGALRQVLLNVLDNAVRYGPDGQKIIARLSSRDGRGVIEVDDEGPGIPDTDRDAVWESYARLDRDVARARTGTGLGLSVVRALVEQMRGRVTLASSARGGTLVTITFPTAPVE